MAKVTGPLMSVEAKGTLGDVLSFQTGFGKHRVTRKPVHGDRQSSGQIRQRDVFAVARDEWGWLTDEEKASYEVLGHVEKMTGYNYFLKEFLKGRMQRETRALFPLQDGAGNKVKDYSGYRIDGTITGATWVQLANGLWVLNFDGDDFVSCGQITRASATEALTLQVWVKPTNWFAGTYMHGVVSSAGGHPNIRFRDVGSGQKANFVWHDGVTWQTLAGLTTVELNRWYFIEVVYNGSTVSLYLNNALNATPKSTIGIGMLLDNLQLGREGTLDRYLKGRLGSVYQCRRVLTAGERKARYIRTMGRYQ